MDPEATLKQLMKAVMDGRRADAAAAAQALVDWLEGDGFMPTQWPVPEFVEND